MRAKVNIAENTRNIDELVGASRKGIPGAKEKLALTVLPRVRRTVKLAYGSRPDHEDLIQNALVKVFSNLDTFRGESGFLVWVDRVTVNTIKDSFKKKRLVFLFRDADRTDELSTSGCDDPEHDVSRRRLFYKLECHLARLKPKYRLPVVLHLYQGYTIPEVAALLDISFDSAKMRVRRGRTQLVERLRKDPACSRLVKEHAS